MQTDEQEIYLYLQAWRATFVSAMEICRRAASRKRYLKDPEWAKPILLEMVRKGLVESNPSGHYRLRPSGDRPGNRKWVSPHIAGILKSSGRDFGDTVFLVEDEGAETLTLAPEGFETSDTSIFTKDSKPS